MATFDRVLYEKVKGFQADGLSRRAACRNAGVPESTMRSWETLADRGEDEDGPTSFTTAIPLDAGPWTVEKLLEAHRLDPAKWTIVRVRGGRWGNPEEPMHQLRFDAVPSAHVIAPPDPGDYKPLPKPSAPVDGDRSFVYISDHHAPYIDRRMHVAVCAMLADAQPDLIVCGGDSADYASVSKYRDVKQRAAAIQACNRGVYTFVQDYRRASPRSRVVMLPGNHDDRLEYYLADHAPAVIGMGPAFEEDIPSYALRRLWRLDDLGVELMEGEWDKAKFPIADEFTARHGYMVGENTPRTMLSKHGRSQIQGHSHRLRFTYRTSHDPLKTQVAIEAGCACEIEDGLGYATEPDWQNGLVTGHVWGDETFTAAPAPYLNGSLLMPDGKRYEATETL